MFERHHFQISAHASAVLALCIPGQYLTVGYERLLSLPFQLITHYRPICQQYTVRQRHSLHCESVSIVSNACVCLVAEKASVTAISGLCEWDRNGEL